MTCNSVIMYAYYYYPVITHLQFRKLAQGTAEAPGKIWTIGDLVTHSWGNNNARSGGGWREKGVKLTGSCLIGNVMASG